MTTIIKRQNGTIVSAILAGNHMAVPTSIPKGLRPETPKKARKKKDGSASANIDANVADDASAGQKLSVRLFTASQIADVEERTKKCFALGKLAKKIGSGDPDVQAALQAAKKNQVDSIPDTESEHLDTQGVIFDTWGAAFVGGFTAKVNAKGEATAKPYLLRVTIPEYRNGIDKVAAVCKEQTYGTFGEAERAANRWWVVKTEAGEHNNGMTVTIETLDLDATEACDEYITIPSLTYVVTREAAASKMEAQRRREKAEAALAGKGKPRSLSFGTKVKETRVTFSRG